jgi:hypothetical protein
VGSGKAKDKAPLLTFTHQSENPSRQIVKIFYFFFVIKITKTGRNEREEEEEEEEEEENANKRIIRVKIRDDEL